MLQAAFATPTLRYMLQPGDGTRYEFSISLLCEARHFPTLGRALDPDGETLETPDVGQVVSGVGLHGSGYITLTIHSPGNGSCELPIEQVKDPHRYLAQYVVGKTGVGLYTAMAILLAISILVDYPRLYHRASQKMLRAPAKLMEEK